MCNLFGPAMAGPAEVVSEAAEMLLWLLANREAVFLRQHTLLLDAELHSKVALLQKQRQRRVVGSKADEPAEGDGGSPPEMRRVVTKHEARNAKELTTEVGDVVRLRQGNAATGWTNVVRVTDEASGLVPTRSLGPLTTGTELSSSRGASDGVASPSQPRRVTSVTSSPGSRAASVDLTGGDVEEHLLARYLAFEKMAVEALMAEREAKKELELVLAELEGRAM